MDPFIIFFGFLVLIAGIYGVISDRHYSKYGYHTVGTVVRNSGEWSAIGSKFTFMYYPIISFQSEDNRSVERKLGVGASLPLYREGESVKIIYYEDQIHPAGKGWSLLYWLILMAGLITIIHQLSKLLNSKFWADLDLFWQSVKSIL